MESRLLTERDGPLAILTLNRPQAKNALDQDLIAELLMALRQAGDDPKVSVVVLAAAGTAFCAGADLKELSQLASAGESSLAAAANQRQDLFRALRNLPKAVIASVNGAALGGGAGLAMSCDLVIAGGNAYFAYPESKRGVVPGAILVSLSRLIGQRQALDLILSGRSVLAAEALQLGMVNRVVAAERLSAETLTYARGFATEHLKALKYTKALFYQICELDYDRALEQARDINLLARPPRSIAPSPTPRGAGEGQGGRAAGSGVD